MYTTRDATYSYVRRRFSLSSSVSVVISEDESELVCFEAWNTDARTCSTRRRFSLSCLRVPVSEDESELVGIETWNTDARVRRGEKVPPLSYWRLRPRFGKRVRACRYCEAWNTDARAEPHTRRGRRQGGVVR
jgi:hypothetical protein